MQVWRQKLVKVGNTKYRFDLKFSFVCSFYRLVNWSKINNHPEALPQYCVCFTRLNHKNWINAFSTFSSSKIIFSNLFAAFNDATAKVSTRLGVDHGFVMLLSLLVHKEFLATLCLLPKKQSRRVRLIKSCSCQWMNEKHFWNTTQKSCLRGKQTHSLSSTFQS